MTAHEPTSVVLEQLIRDAPADEITLSGISERLHKRSFGLMMVVLGVFGLIPVIANFAGVALLFPAFQMLLGKDIPSFPHVIADRRIGIWRIARVVARIQPILARLERIVHPRLTDRFGRMKRTVGFAVLLLGLSILSPIPVAHIVPASAVILISFAYLEEDGLFLWIGLAATVVSLSITGATIWGAIRAGDFLGRVL